MQGCFVRRDRSMASRVAGPYVGHGCSVAARSVASWQRRGTFGVRIQMPYRLTRSLRLMLAVWLLCWALPLSGWAGAPVDFSTQVKPILKHHCGKCHAGTRRQGGFSINSRESLLAGGDSGASVAAGDAAGSYLIDLIEEEDADLRMPQESSPLSPEEIAVLKAWVNEGLAWEEGFVFGQLHRRASLAPREIPLPTAAEFDHPIDRLLASYYQQQAVTVPAVVDDRDFCRRVSLDLTGLLPTPERLEAFLGDEASDKRARLVAELLENRRAYAEHWLTMWNDMLRNAYRGPGFIDEGRSQITSWLYRSLYDNKPYDVMVHELISPVAGSEGFVQGIRWRGTVNDSQRREMQAAQNVAQVFLGTNIKCASCHDSFVNNWKVTDAYGLAAVFADETLELHRCNRPMGIRAEVSFIYPELGVIAPEASRAERMNQLADMMVQPANGRLARTIANRLWAQLMGRGLVEPLDDMDAEPWDQDLLDWLASDLVAHQFDLKHTLEVICTSRAYQLIASDEPLAESATRYVFRGPLVKRMSAEQFIDAICSVSGYWPAPTPDMLQRDGRRQGGQLADVADLVGLRARMIAPSQAKWIWSHADAQQAAAGETVYAWHRFAVPDGVRQMFGSFTADNQFTVYLNGTEVATSDNWMVPLVVDLTRFVQAGENLIAVRATNLGTVPNPAGFIGDLAPYDDHGTILDRTITDGTWRVASTEPQGWPQPAAELASRAAVEIAAAAAAPWAISDRLLPAAPVDLQIRSVLFMDDSLNRALGRPNRDQVVTRRESLATTLQAMELTNGDVLDQLLAAGARRCLERQMSIDDLFLAALARHPTSQERSIGLTLLGEVPSEAGWADLFWTIVMLPEFQLIR